MTAATCAPDVRWSLVPQLRAAAGQGGSADRMVPDAPVERGPSAQAPVVRVVVVDDHSLVRDALTDLLESAGGISVIGQCADGTEVADAVQDLHPDVLLLDLQMPRMDGLTAARGVRTAHPEVRIVFLTSGLNDATVREARAIGAAGYLLKDVDPADLPGLIRDVAAGGSAWHPHARALLEDGTGLN
jgi:DNA-binding NarL/FixJ family response regulator